MYQEFKLIEDFTKLRKTCFFCQNKLHFRLTSFTKSIPLLNAPLKNGRFDFELSHVTPEFSLKAQGIVDIKSNALVFFVNEDASTASLDEKVAHEVFVDLHPYVELYCDCKHKYHICSDVLRTKYLGKKIDSWMITELHLFYEGFVDNKLVVHNNFTNNSTIIYSRQNENATPITTSMLDWESMGKDKLLTRIKTLVTFS